MKRFISNILLHNASLRSALIAALAFASLLPAVSFQIRQIGRKGRPATIDSMYEIADKVLPKDSSRVGYLCDEPGETPLGQKMRMQAQYAVSPHLLVDGTGERFTLVNATVEARVSDLARETHLRIVVERGPVALAARQE